MAKKILGILKQYWGYDAFRSSQQEIIESVIAGKDTLALLPTGGGKSICFQIPGLFLGGCTIVISPLIALMKDQVYQLKKRGIVADCLVSGMSKTQIDHALDNCIYGNTQFLYVSPERLKTELFLARLPSIKCNLIAVDEAHCISQWGYDFRPDYLEISNLREYLPNVPIIALTATATPAVAADIQEKLEFTQQHLIQKSFERSNLAYIMQKEEDKFYRLERLIEKTGGSGIVYVQNRRKTEEYAQLLINRKIKALAYHAGLSAEVRAQTQEQWITNQVQVIVATNAFGMGIDKPDVRWVVHFDIPQNPESYFQEAGRAGRDGKKSFSVLMYDDNNLLELEENTIRKYPEKQFIRKVYDWLMNHFQVATGAGMNEMFELDLTAFSKKNNIQPLAAISALKIIALEGLIILPEGSYHLSTVKILVSRSYFNNAENKESAVFDMLLRSYSGLFDFPVGVRESDLAERLEWTLTSTQQILRNMHNKNIIEYKEFGENSKVTLVENRIKGNQISFTRSRYDDLKEQAFLRMQKMKEVVLKYECRSILLLAYFGEKSTENCGKCDYCLDQKRLDAHNKNSDLTNMILNAVKVENMPLKTLVNSFSKLEEHKVIEALEQMEEKGLIEIDTDQTVRSSTKKNQ